MADLVANEELHIEMLVISPDSVETSRVWAESRECGNPVTMLGRWSGPLGVLDTIATWPPRGWCRLSRCWRGGSLRGRLLLLLISEEDYLNAKILEEIMLASCV